MIRTMPLVTLTLRGLVDRRRFWVMVLLSAVPVLIAIVGPIARLVPLPGVSAAAAATIAAVLSLLILCFLAGLVARTVMAGRPTGTLEQRVLAHFPAYGLIKSTAEGLVGWQQAEGLSPALLRFDWNAACHECNQQQQQNVPPAHGDLLVLGHGRDEGGGTRTHNLGIKSPLLYQLSYAPR